MILSFIVPFYNVEKYITDCLNSLYAQDILEKDYEVICIDDCSPDGSKQIVQDYQKLHPNLVLIEHEENKGLGGARNTGMKAAKGEYLWFIDSDDCIRINCLKELIDICETDALDVLMFNFERIDSKNKVVNREIVFKDSGVYSGIDYIKNIWGNEFAYHLGFVWRNIYKTDYLRDKSMLFPEHVYWEDTAFMPKALFYAKKVHSVKDVYYQYRINPASVSGVFDKELRADLMFQFSFNAGKDLLDFSKEIKKIDTEISDNLYSKSIWYFNKFIFSLLKTSVKQKRQFFQLVKTHRILMSSLLAYMNKLNRILCRYPNLGYVLSLVMSPFYKIKSKIK